MVFLARLVISGVVILIIGIISVNIFTMYTNDCDSSIGKIFQFFSSEHSENCINAQYGQIGSLIICFIGIGIIIGGAFAPKNGFTKEPSRYICGYCNYVAESERELYNHSINCEKYKNSKR